MTDDLTLLASTYLDGEATPDERARVEADEALLAEVERLRSARAMLLDARWYERPADEVRESAIAAAFAAWDVQGTNVAGPGSDARQAVVAPAVGTPAVRRSPVVSFERRRTYRWLTAAAAVVAVAALGVVVAQSGGGGDSDESTAFEAAADTVARAETDTEFSEQGGEPPSATADALVSSDAAADDGGGDDAESGALADAPSTVTEAPDDTAAASATEAAAAEPTALAVMQTSEDLGAVAADAQLALENGTNREVLAPPCPDAAFDDIDQYVAMGTYRDRSVVIGIDVEDDRAIAVDSDTCEIVAEAPLP